MKLFEKVRKEAFKIGIHNGKLYPLQYSYSKNKTFVHGIGRFALNKIRTIEPLNCENPKETIMKYLNEYGYFVLVYALGIENDGDCVNRTALSQLNSFFCYPDKFFNFFQDLEGLNSELCKIISEKWGLTTNGKWFETEKTQGNSGCSYVEDILLEADTDILCGCIPTAPFIDWMAYEKNLNRFIHCFTPKGLYYNSDEQLTVMEKLDNESVSDKLEYITNKEFIEKVKQFNEAYRSKAKNKETAV